MQGIVLFDDFVQIYEPSLSRVDIMSIAEEFVKTHSNKVIIFAATSKNLTEFSKRNRGNFSINQETQTNATREQGGSLTWGPVRSGEYPDPS